MYTVWSLIKFTVLWGNAWLRFKVCVWGGGGELVTLLLQLVYWFLQILHICLTLLIFKRTAVGSFFYPHRWCFQSGIFLDCDVLFNYKIVFCFYSWALNKFKNRISVTEIRSFCKDLCVCIQKYCISEYGKYFKSEPQNQNVDGSLQCVYFIVTFPVISLSNRLT